LKRFRSLAISAAGTGIATLAFLVSACTNGLTIAGHSTASSTGSTGNGSNDSLTNSQFITVDRVIEDPNTSGVFDLEGDGSNAIGVDCTASGTSSSSNSNYQGSGTSTCQCYYQYTDPSTGDSESIYVDTSYFEANMVQCPYSTIPPTVQKVTVSLYQTASGQTSNAIVFPLTGTNLAIDPTNLINYAKVNRYQCKDVVSILLPWATGNTSSANVMYDPIQSEYPDISYPLNFYTTNYGDAFSEFAQAALQNWNCPSLPNDPAVPGLDLRVWSVGPDTAGSSNIYPPAGSAFDRSTFYVAKQPTGVFNVPVNTYIAPTLFGGQNGAGNTNATGYAAAPVATSSTTEGCPDSSTPIPPGYQWAKLWLFRADLAPRYYRTSSVIASVQVGCNPGTDSLNNYAFNDCGTTGGLTATGGENPSTAAVPLADRVLAGEGTPASGNVLCVNIDGSEGGAGFNCAYGTGEGPGCWTGTETTAQFGAGTDLWDPRGVVVTQSSPQLTDPLQIFGNSTGIAQHVPKDMSPSSVDLDVNNPRFDFLVVVTPVSVMAAQMENTSSSLNYPYTPYRFPSKQDCQSSNPNNPSFSGDCNPSKKITYGLKLHDISTNGDPPSGAQNETGVYPMCVLQPI
jgi:hypothetical protein